MGIVRHANRYLNTAAIGINASSDNLDVPASNIPLKWLRDLQYFFSANTTLMVDAIISWMSSRRGMNIQFVGSNQPHPVISSIVRANHNAESQDLVKIIDMETFMLLEQVGI